VDRALSPVQAATAAAAASRAADTATAGLSALSSRLGAAMEQTGALEWRVESVERQHAAAAQKATAATEALSQQVAVQARTLVDVTNVTRHQHVKQITEGM
jgi:hypothetical protein